MAAAFGSAAWAGLCGYVSPMGFCVSLAPHSPMFCLVSGVG